MSVGVGVGVDVGIGSRAAVGEECSTTKISHCWPGTGDGVRGS